MSYKHQRMDDSTMVNMKHGMDEVEIDERSDSVPIRRTLKRTDMELEKDGGRTNPNLPPPNTFRMKLYEMFHSYRFHLLVVLMVVLDCFIVIAQLIIELNVLQQEKRGNKHEASLLGHLAVNVLHYISITILCIFTIEIFAKVYALRKEFFTSKMELFDAFIILTSLVLDLYYLDHHEKQNAIFSDLVIILRLWRVVRILHGIIHSVKTPLEHKLEKAKEKAKRWRDSMEKEKAYACSLEDEITQLRSLLQKNHIDDDHIKKALRRRSQESVEEQ